MISKKKDTKSARATQAFHNKPTQHQPSSTNNKNKYVLYRFAIDDITFALLCFVLLF